MLTARELHQMEFHRTFRGYNEKEVDAFIRKLVGAYEALVRENKELKARIEKEQPAVASLPTRGGEDAEEVVRLARQAAKETKESAAREAAEILEQARSEAAAKQAQAERDIAEAEERLRRLSDEEAYVLRRLRTLVNECSALIDQVEQAEPASQVADGGVADESVEGGSEPPPPTRASSEKVS